MIFRLGLTGSIGMGKSTTAAMFAEAGCAVWDADAAVHRLYEAGGAAVAPMAALAPAAVRDGAVSRPALRAAIAADPDLLARIEALVHPLVRADREAFAAAQAGRIGVFDIPLLFETEGAAEMDGVAVVSTDAATQRARVLARGSMSAAAFEAIRAKQMPDAEKRARADWVIDTSDLETARAGVREVLHAIRERTGHA
ncbi:dephospho-CoA kinase [Roseivivax sp. CAU 1761]